MSNSNEVILLKRGKAERFVITFLDSEGQQQRVTETVDGVERVAQFNERDEAEAFIAEVDPKGTGLLVVTREIKRLYRKQATEAVAPPKPKRVRKPRAKAAPQAVSAEASIPGQGVSTEAPAEVAAV